MNRNQLVKEIMEKEGLKMIEASQYIKQNKLYTPKANVEKTSKTPKTPKTPKISKMPKANVEKTSKNLKTSKTPKISKISKLLKKPESL